LATIAQIRADLVGSSASFRSEMIAGQRQANISLAAVRGDVKATAESLATLNKAAAGFIGFEAIKAGVENLLEAQKAAQQIHYSLLSATGSGTAADAAYKAVSATAEKLGLDLQSSALGFASMSAAASANGVTMKDQQALFDALARSSTVLHLSSEQTGRAITALSQIFGKGKIQAEELRQQLGDAVPGVVPRFQAAVMQMIKGTDLAGKSFDQLLQSGDVTVQKFLPALIQALNATGAGAEQAAGGLNASINRLSTEWFKLKTDLSGGLFSDVAMASVDLMAKNLDHLASVAGVVAGVGLARLAGGGASSAAGAATSGYQQAILGPRMAADADAAYAKVARGAAEAAAADVHAAEAALARNAAWQASAVAAADESRGALAVAFANNEAAQATLAHQAGAASLSANLRAQRIALAEAAAAQAAITKAEQTYDAAMASGSVLAERRIALEAELAAAKTRGALASEAAAAATARADAAAAATGAFALVQKGAASLGNLAIGLVGGPWGAAALAIGAVGYAIYDTQKRSEDYRRETDELAKSIAQVRQEAEDTAKTFGDLDGSMTFKQGIEQYKQESTAIAGQRAALADLQAQAEAIQARIASRSSGTAGGAFANLFDQRELDGINDRIKALQQQIDPAANAVDALGNKLSGALAPSIDSVKRALDQLSSGKSLMDVVFDLSSSADNGIAAADAALASVRASYQKFQTEAKTLSDKAATEGMTNVQRIQYEYRQALAQIDKLPVGSQSTERGQLTSTYALAVQSASQKDAADAAKKAATEAASKAREWQQQADNLNQSLLRTHDELDAQLDSTQKLTPAEKLLQDIVGGTNDAYNHATKALQQKMLAQAQANAELSKAVVLQQQETAAAARSAALNEQLAARIQRQNEASQIVVAGVGHGREATQQLQDELRIRQEYDRQRQQYDKEAGRLPAGSPGSVGSSEYDSDVAKMMASQQQELAIYRAGAQARLEAEQDWRNGAVAALEDYRSSANDVAGQTQQAFSDAFSGLEDALVNFAQTGKLSFTSLANSIIADLTRMQVRAAASGLFQYAAQAIGSYFGGQTAGVQSLGGDTSYLNSSYNTGQYGGSFSFGGGRASGGPTTGGTIYEVAEQGPEVYRSGGRTYLLSGQDGQVSPVTSGGSLSSDAYGSAGGLVVNITNNTEARVTAKRGRDGNGMPSLDVLIDMVDSGLADRVATGRSRTGNAIAQRTGTSMAATL